MRHAVYINHYHASYVYGISAGISRRMYEKYFEQSYLSFTKNNSAQAVRLIVMIPFEYAFNVLLAVINILNEFLIISFIFIALSFYNFKIILLLTLLFIPLMFLAYSFRNNKLSAINNRLKNDYDLILKRLLSGIDCFVDLKLNKKQDFYINQFDELNKKHADDLGYIGTLQSSTPEIIELLAVFAICILLSFYILYAHNESALILQLSVFAVATFRVLPSINRIFTNYVQLKTYFYTVTSLKENLTNNPNDRNRLPVERISFEKSIQLQNINFTYPGAKNKCLEDVHLVIKKGEKIGIAGKSGIGKTTLIHILLGLLDEYGGIILVDECRLCKRNLTAWQELVSYVPQSPVIIDTGFKENIALGENEENIDLLKLHDVIRMAQLEELEQSFQMDWRERIGENGANLSGGQKQRIAIARALYRSTPVLVFDEPFSNLDRQMENEITKIIDQLSMTGKTIIIISHHAHSLAHCDEVYELKDGMLDKINIKKHLHIKD
jgi:ABC-type bacteriocin/lantibiotic exporter with double-glycine peptidase domain